MTDEQKRIVSTLRDGCNDCSCMGDKFMCNLGPCENLNAATVIEQMSTEIASLRAENENIRQTRVTHEVYQTVPDELETYKQSQHDLFMDLC